VDGRLVPAEGNSISVHVDIDRPHLGGYIEGGDDATRYPDLWQWLVQDYQCHSVIDVGCGEGDALRFFLGAGAVEVLGVDGIDQPGDLIVQHDFTAGTFNLDRRFDLCWCCEFVEHVEERYLPNVMSAFFQAEIVLMTHAFPGQVGHHHVNCRPADYWVGAMAANGHQYDHTLTVITRDLAATNLHPLNHYVRSGLAFRR
jgi:hypothetical protein